MGLGNSVPHRCNQVHLDTRLLGVMSVTHLVSIHLKDFDSRDSMVLKHVVDLYIGAEGDPLFI